MARRKIGATLARSSRIGVSVAAMNSSGGRKSSSTRSGSRVIRGNPGTKARSSPPSTNSVGYGTPSRSEARYSTAMATSVSSTAVRISTRERYPS